MGYILTHKTLSLSIKSLLYLNIKEWISWDGILFNFYNIYIRPHHFRTVNIFICMLIMMRQDDKWTKMKCTELRQTTYLSPASKYARSCPTRLRTRWTTRISMTDLQPPTSYDYHHTSVFLHMSIRSTHCKINFCMPARHPSEDFNIGAHFVALARTQTSQTKQQPKEILPEV